MNTIIGRLIQPLYILAEITKTISPHNATDKAREYSELYDN